MHSPTHIHTVTCDEHGLLEKMNNIAAAEYKDMNTHPHSDTHPPTQTPTHTDTPTYIQTHTVTCDEYGLLEKMNNIAAAEYNRRTTQHHGCRPQC